MGFGTFRNCTDVFGNTLFRIDPRPDAQGLFKRSGCDPHRTDRISLDRNKLYSHGHIADISGLFSGDGVRRKKFFTDRDPDSFLFCAAWMAVFTARAEHVLAHISFDGNDNDTHGLLFL